jgi:hypothetical protein
MSWESVNARKFQERMTKMREERNERERTYAIIANKNFEYELGDIVVVTTQKNRIGKIIFIFDETERSEIVIGVSFPVKNVYNYGFHSFEVKYCSTSELRKATPKEIELCKATFIAEEL